MMLNEIMPNGEHFEVKSQGAQRWCLSEIPPWLCPRVLDKKLAIFPDFGGFGQVSVNHGDKRCVCRTNLTCDSSEGLVYLKFLPIVTRNFLWGSDRKQGTMNTL